LFEWRSLLLLLLLDLVLLIEFVVKNATRFFALCASGFVVAIGNVYLDVGFATFSATKHERTFPPSGMAGGRKGGGFLAFLDGGGGGAIVVVV